MKLIGDKQIKLIHNVLDDVTGLIECNCGDPCEGTCTFSMAEAALKFIDLLPEAVSQDPLMGRRFRSLIQDMEEDGDYGEVKHPAGSTFVVGDCDHVEKCEGKHILADRRHVCGRMYCVQWEQAINKQGESVPAIGMWTIWSEHEIQRDAVEVTA